MLVFEITQKYVKPVAWTVCQASTTELLSSSTQLADATHSGRTPVEAIAQGLCWRRWHRLWVQRPNIHRVLVWHFATQWHRLVLDW